MTHDALNMSLPNKLVFLDTETTGGSLRTDRVIEIGMLRVENGQVVKTFNSLINPQRYVPPEIELLTGISGAMVDTAPTFFELKDQILEMMEDAVFVAHNARFDYGFIKTELKRLGINFSAKQLCTVKLSRNLYPQHSHHNLSVIIERFGFQIKNRHRAFDDAEVLWKFYQQIQQEFSLELVEAAVNKAQKRPSIPTGLSTEILDSLPETPGVYIFYGESGLPLYVGKSVNIRDRVLSHFSADHTSSTELKITQQIRSIEAIQTEGELGALLKEAYLVKKMQPLYNRKLRQKNKLLVLKYAQNENEYFYCSFGIQEAIDPLEIDKVIGVFRSKKSLQEFLFSIAKEHQLCEKLLGVDKTSTACFGYRLGRCKGACTNKEKPLFYNFRFMNILGRMKFKKWPFEQPIIIDDYSHDGSSCDSFIINNWCVLGKINSEGTKMDTVLDVGFDLDTYKILNSCLNKPKYSKHLRLIKPEQLQQIQL
jgi:DNA polymerase-3 subunit epsilon